jgi:GIY-YIG catalytic domain-containing protein
MMYVVYCHTSTITGKSYVGYTKKGIEARWNEHVALAHDKRARSKHRRYHFHDAIRKYGTETWTHRALQDELKTLDAACDAEVRWIAALSVQAPYGYNETRGGRGVFMTAEGKLRHKLATREALARPDVRQRYLEGIRRGHSTPEFLANNRAAQKLARRRPEVIAKKRVAMQKFYADPKWKSPVARAVEQLTLDGVVVASYSSAMAAAMATGVNYTKITEVARGNRTKTGGFMWRYVSARKSAEER